MASHNRNSGDDFEKTLLSEGVTKSTLERLRKEEITDWSTLAILTSDDISELGLPLGQKALVRNLTQRRPSGNDAQGNQQGMRGQQVMSSTTDADKVASFSNTATEYVKHRQVSRDDTDGGDIYDESSLDSPAQNQPISRPTPKIYPKVITKPNMTSASGRTPKSSMTSEPTTAPKLHAKTGPSRSHGTPDSTRASESHVMSDSSRSVRSNMASTNAPEQNMTSEPQPMGVPEKTLALPTVGRTSHISKLLTMSGDLKNAAKNIIQNVHFESKPAARPTIEKIDSSPMKEPDPVPGSRRLKPRLSGGFTTNTGICFISNV